MRRRCATQWSVLGDVTVLSTSRSVIATDKELEEFGEDLMHFLKEVIDTPCVAVGMEQVSFFVPDGFLLLHVYDKIVAADGRTMFVFGMQPQIQSTCWAFHFERILRICQRLQDIPQSQLHAA
jgi:hypothetical protein